MRTLVARLTLAGTLVASSLVMLAPAAHAFEWECLEFDKYHVVSTSQGDYTLPTCATFYDRGSAIHLPSDTATTKYGVLFDTAGFIDPVFSSGLFITMDGAITLADCIQRNALPEYEAHVHKHLKSWQQIVSYFYDGKLFACFRMGQKYRDTAIGKMIFPHMDKHMGRIFTGAAAMAPYSRSLLNFSMRMTTLSEGEQRTAEMAVS